MTPEELDEYMWKDVRQTFQEAVDRGLLDEYEVNDAFDQRDIQEVRQLFLKAAHRMKLPIDGTELMDEISIRAKRLGIDEAINNCDLDGLQAITMLVSEEIASLYREKLKIPDAE